MKIAVAGGTGVVGRYVVEAARLAGHEATVLSRGTGVDLTAGATGAAGAALAAGLEGVDAIVDASNKVTVSGRGTSDFFVTATNALQQAGAAAGVQRLVTISIVNVDTVPYAYYRAKLAQEAAAQAGPIPATILRATQFHEFPAQIMLRSRKGPVAVIPKMRSQTVAARTVGEVAVELATNPPADPIVNLGGPEAAEVADLARAIVAKRGERVRIVSVPIPGRAGRLMATGGLIPGRGARLAGPTFAEWLESGDLDVVGR